MTFRTEPFVEQLRREAFASERPAASPPRFGAEIEFIPVAAVTRRVAGIETGDAPTLPVIRSIAARHGWSERFSAKAGVPEWRTANGGRLTYEPGGQVEYASPPNESVSRLVDDLDFVAGLLGDALAGIGVDLMSAGLDPLNTIEDVPLALSAERYSRMDAHFRRIGPYGPRMMRQTASIQICLDLGNDSSRRYELLNALTPFLVAIFANSPLYSGAATGYQSTRRLIWQELDPGRTGIVAGGADPATAYARFALRAPAILLGAPNESCRPFVDHARTGAAGLDEWRTHLTTLFPEVRPRGYLEVRSIDAIDPGWYAAPLALLAGLVHHPRSALAAREIAGPPDAALLARAGRCGLADPFIHSRASALVSLALSGCESLGTDVVSTRDMDVLAAFAARYTSRRRSPADDLLDQLGRSGAGETKRPAGSREVQRATLGA